MKAIIILSISFSIFFSPCQVFSKNKRKKDNEINNSLKAENLHGKVKSVSDKVYDILNGKHNILSYTVTYYSIDGYMTYSNVYSIKDSSFQKQNKYVYDPKFHLTGILDSLVEGFTMFTLFRNDTAGHDTASAFFNKGINGPELVSNTTSKYNSKGQLIERKEYNIDNLLKSKTTNSYDDEGNLSEFIIYTGDEQIKERFAYKYDKKKNKIETINYDKSGNVLHKYNYEYKDVDKRGNWHTFIRYEGGKAQFLENRTIEYYP